MSDAKISALTALTGAAFDVAADFLVVVDTSATTTKKMLPDQAALTFESKGANIASAAGPDIWTVGQTHHITGTTNITSFAAAPLAGMWRKLYFDGAVLLSNGANFVVQGAADYTTAAGDVVFVYADTTTKFYLFLFKANGTAVGAVATQAIMETATNNTAPVTALAVNWHPGVVKAWCRATVAGAVTTSFNMTSVTDNGAGDITFTIGTDFSSANYVPHITAQMGVSGPLILQPYGQLSGSTACLAKNATTLAATDPDNWNFSAVGDQ